MGSTGPFVDLMVVNNNYRATDARAWRLGACSECMGTQMAVIASSLDETTKWLRCVNCSAGAVLNEGDVQSPAPQPLRVPAGVVGVEAQAWSEVRKCLAVGANTAAVMMCRKLLLYVAVQHGLPPKNDRGKAPLFVEVVDHLEAQGLFTPRMRPWVDRIKDVGNEGAHEIEPVTAATALDVATFTEQLLRLTYEMQALMAADDQPAP